MKNTAWIFKGKPFKINNLDKYWGFVYKISNTETGEFYIGSKQFKFTKNLIMSKKKKKEHFEQSGLRRKRIKIVNESDWKTYQSSSKKVQEMLILNPNIFKFEILQLFENKSEMLLTEAILIGNEFLRRNPLILNDWLNLKCQKSK